jgi:hypothetical protein
MVQPFIDNATNVSVKVDEQNIQKGLLVRVKSAPFEAAFPNDNFFGQGVCGSDPLLGGSIRHRWTTDIMPPFRL